MPRKREGTVYQKPDGSFGIRITLNDGSRKRLKGSFASEQEAIEAALEYSKQAKDLNLAAKESLPKPQTVDEYVPVFIAARVSKGHTSTKDDWARYRQHVKPLLGHKAMVDITRADIESVVARLDARIDAGEVSWTTAKGAWALVSKLFRDASGSKNRTLRVLASNPAQGVEGPDRGPRRSGCYLYPREFLQLVSCETVPLEWRRTYALAVYTGLRAGELEALTWPDIDFASDSIYVHKAMQRGTGTIGLTKTESSRKVPIEPNLLPLLLAMRDEAGGASATGPVVTTRLRDGAWLLRQHLQTAGVARADLFVAGDDKARRPLVYHSLRSTYATWSALRGDSPWVVMRRCGHRRIDTTNGYVQEAETLGPSVGQPFPQLPASLLNKPPLESASGNGQAPNTPHSDGAPKYVGKALTATKPAETRTTPAETSNCAFEARSNLHGNSKGNEEGLAVSEDETLETSWAWG